MLLTVKDLKIHFKHDSGVIKAVDGISFEVRENEVVGLVGESGSGKTVTALSLMKLLPKKSCLVSGEITGEKMAMIFQEPFTSLNPVLSVGEQIDEAVLIRERIAKKTAKSRTISLLEQVKIKDPERIYDSYPHLLSGGQRQRAMIAMAIALRPKLLIADEPTTALDVTIQAEILDLILSLKKDLQMSVLFITHDFGIIKKLADRVLVMKDGKIIESGLKNEVLSSPKEDYTKKLLDAVPQIVSANGDRSFHLDKQKIENLSPPKRIIITVKNLSKSFPIEKGMLKEKKGFVSASRNINLEVKEGKTLGLVGESGSGKTTLGKLLIRLIKPDSGEIISAAEKSTQIVFQDPMSSLDPRMRMQDIVLEGATIRGIQREKKDAILRDILFKVHLNDKDRLKYPHQFSGGQRQRIAIARALAVNPKILILDEPVSSLDVIIQKEILNLLKELQKELSLTYVFISHDLRVVSFMADDVAVMRDGEIVEFASREQIYFSPKHPYTKQLFSSILKLGR